MHLMQRSWHGSRWQPAVPKLTMPLAAHLSILVTDRCQLSRIVSNASLVPVPKAVAPETTRRGAERPADDSRPHNDSGLPPSLSPSYPTPSIDISGAQERPALPKASA